MYSKTFRLMAVSVLLLAASIASPQQILKSEVPGPGSTPTDGPSSEIDLSEAIRRALSLNPGLSVVDFKVKAAEARVQQAGTLPNPELEFELENFGGQDELNGVEGADSTIAIAQQFLLGGDRARRRDLAKAWAQVASGDYDLRRRDLVYRTTTAFFKMLAVQQEHALAGELLDLAKRLARTVDARVEAGKVSPVESTRARIETTRSQVALSFIGRRVNEAKVSLSVTWNETDPDFEEVTGELPSPGPLPPLLDLEERLLTGPEAEMMRRNERLQEHSVELERAVGVPDLRLSLGSRQFHGTGRSAWVAGLSIPIPVFDRNQGERRAAEFELEGARRATQAVKGEQNAQLRGLVEHLAALENAVLSIVNVIEPSAAEAFEAVEIGYLEGKFAFADLLLAQQSLFEARRLALESRLEYALALCDLERLVGPISQKDPAQKDKL